MALGAVGPLVKPIGVGMDLVDVPRVERMLERFAGRALRRLLTDGERAYCEGQARPAQHVAARLAAKEATWKALQTDNQARMVGWRDIEVVRGLDGAPAIALHGPAGAVAGRLKVGAILVSLSHTSSQAAAIVLLLA